MFTENEINALVTHPKIQEITTELKNNFIEKSAPYLEMSNHDFMSLAMLTPTIGVALANGSVSLIEEMALNKKARKLSKGGYWMKKDPVVYGMGHLIKHFDDWSDAFLAYLKVIVEFSCDKAELLMSKVHEGDVSDEQFLIEVLRAPFIFIRLLSSFFHNDEEEDFVAIRNISRVEYDRMIDYADKIGMGDVPIFKKYVTKLQVK